MPLLLLLQRLFRRRRSRRDQARSKVVGFLEVLAIGRFLRALSLGPAALLGAGAVAGAIALIKRRRAQRSLGAPSPGLDVDAPNQSGPGAEVPDPAKASTPAGDSHQGNGASSSEDDDESGAPAAGRAAADEDS